MEFSNNEKQVINTSQEIYDSFNGFIFSSDSKVFSKLIARTLLFNEVVDVPGDIVECGVFKGSGILTWLKLKKVLRPNSFKKVIGFDFFNTEMLLNSLSGVDRERMENLFTSRNFNLDESYITVLSKIIEECGFNESCYELIKGDVSITSQQYAKNRIGAKVSLLYMDLDIDKPTYDVLECLWDKISYGGIIAFDEYAYHQWSETLGVDRFFQSKKLKIKTLDYSAPTAYVRKEFI